MFLRSQHLRRWASTRAQATRPLTPNTQHNLNKRNNTPKQDTGRDRVSPTYFSGRPLLFDTVYQMDNLLQSHQDHLPTDHAAQLPDVSIKQHPWISRSVLQEAWHFKLSMDEYQMLLHKLNQLQSIANQISDAKINTLLHSFKRPETTDNGKQVSTQLDEWGRAYAVGYRRRLKAHVWLTEAKQASGLDAIRIDGVDFVDVLHRLADRAKVVMPFEVTDTMGKYKVWCEIETAMDGMEKGPSAISDAVANGIANALVVHEPGLEKWLNEGG